MVKIFADGSDLDTMINQYRNEPIIKGWTTNPTLMKKSGVVDYEKFACTLLLEIKDKPVSFEVFADAFGEMYRQAMRLSSWSDNVYVKIPVTNTNGIYNYALVETLSNVGVKVNVTALTTPTQVADILPALKNTVGAYISVFAGRIADTGVDPLPIMQSALNLIKDASDKVELIWASPREVLNVVQANEIGCHIITCTKDIIAKLPLLGKDLKEYSRETVQMFYKDAESIHFGII